MEKTVIATDVEVGEIELKGDIGVKPRLSSDVGFPEREMVNKYFEATCTVTFVSSGEMTEDEFRAAIISKAMGQPVKTPHLFKGGHMDEQMIMMNPEHKEVLTLNHDFYPPRLIKYRNIGHGILSQCNDGKD